MWRYVADMGIMLRYVINGIELGQLVEPEHAHLLAPFASPNPL